MSCSFYVPIHGMKSINLADGTVLGLKLKIIVISPSTGVAYEVPAHELQNNIALDVAGVPTFVPSRPKTCLPKEKATPKPPKVVAKRLSVNLTRHRTLDDLVKQLAGSRNIPSPDILSSPSSEGSQSEFAANLGLTRVEDVETRKENTVKRVNRPRKNKLKLSSMQYVDQTSNRSYTQGEDMSILKWLLEDEVRLSKVNGNQIWRELQDCWSKVSDTKRSWHSLRNRYLRYLLPGLHNCLSLTDREKERLRAGAARIIPQPRPHPHQSRLLTASGRGIIQPTRVSLPRTKKRRALYNPRSE